MRKKWILLGIYSILLCMTVSFSWILLQQKYSGGNLFLGYGLGDDNGGGKLVISPTDVDMTLFVLKDGVWRTAARSSDRSSQNKLFTIEPHKVIPDASVPFRIRFENKSEDIITLKLTISGIVCDEALMPENDTNNESNSAKDILFIGSKGSLEYSKYSEIRQPDDQYLPLSDGTLISTDDENNTKTYEFVLYKEIEVPVMNKGEYVELDCYFYFDKDAMTNSCQNKTFYVSSFRAEQQ